MSDERLRPSTLSGVAAVLSLTLVGCFAHPAVSPTATATATATATPTATITASPTQTPVCDANLVLRQVDELLAGQTFEAHYLTINRELTLSVWLVDPEIDPDASEKELAQNNRQALERGIAVASHIISQQPCARQVFDSFNPMIVDSRYQTWYIDFIPVRAFPESDSTPLDDLIDSLERSGVGAPARRKYPPEQDEQPIPADACGWPDARAAIRRQFGSERRNAAAYLLISAPSSSQGPWNDYGTTNIVVQAQWDIDDGKEADEGVVLDHLNSLAEALACLWPPIDLLEVFLVVPSGQMVIYGMVPGSVIRKRMIPLPPEKVLLRYTFQDEQP